MPANTKKATFRLKLERGTGRSMVEALATPLAYSPVAALRRFERLTIIQFCKWPTSARHAVRETTEATVVNRMVPEVTTASRL